MYRNLVAVGMLAALIGAQQPTSERPSPEDALRDKLASPFLHHADWTTDYATALRVAAGEDKLVLGYFTTAYY